MGRLQHARLSLGSAGAEKKTGALIGDTDRVPNSSYNTNIVGCLKFSQKRFGREAVLQMADEES